MDGFLAIVRQIVAANGLPDAQVRVSRKLLTLPGYFRPTKVWDVVVIHEGRLVAALLLSPRSGIETGEYSDLSEMTSVRTFIAGFAARVAVEAARR